MWCAPALHLNIRFYKYTFNKLLNVQLYSRYCKCYFQNKFILFNITTCNNAAKSEHKTKVGAKEQRVKLNDKAPCNVKPVTKGSEVKQ